MSIKKLLFTTLIFINLIIFASSASSQEKTDSETEKPESQKQDQPEARNMMKFADDAKFQNARHFYKMKMHDHALREFNEYIEIFINGNHRREVFLAMGSIYFDRFEYLRAIKSYGRLFEEFSNTDEGVEGYFRMGTCYQKMGYDEKAVEIYKAILEEYSSSRFADQAKIQVELIEILKKD
jgi:TolA-binding protein